MDALPRQTAGARLNAKGGEGLVYGHNPEEKIVAVSQRGDNLVRVYVRREGRIVTEDVELFPFFFLSDASYLGGFLTKYWLKELSGTNYYRCLCAFSQWSAMWEAIRHARDAYNKTASKKAEHFGELPVIHVRPDPVSQFLLQSGRTLFKGMQFEDLYRVQLDIKTYSKIPFQFSNPSRPEDRIIIIALSDNCQWTHIIDGRKYSEKEMLETLTEILREKDPDVIEGHNIQGFDLPYIMQRCEMLGVEFAVGRDGSTPRLIETPTAAPPPAGLGDQGNYEIEGRHVLDTLLLLQSYDAAKRRLESYSLKHAAQHFGLAQPGRVYIRGERISWHWDNEPDQLIRYALDDVNEVRGLSDLLSPSSFYLTQMVSLDYGTLIRTGSAAKIESLLLREYVREKHSVPRPQVGSQKSGGYTDIFYRGVMGPVVHVDVESLYPSIIISEDLAPKSDALRIFPVLLHKLTQMRLEAKKRMLAAEDPRDIARFDAEQSSYKILINSFYGYLGYSRGLFNDYEQADRVTARGQAILRMLIEELRKNDCKVIEVDTDGIFFVPPPAAQTAEDEEQLISKLERSLPKNIHLATAGRYKRMLSYKKKNYALLGYDDKITIKGSSLISRSIERFGRNYIQQCIECLLAGNLERLHTLYVSLYKDILEHKVDIWDLARTETLKDSREQYEKDVHEGKRNRTASYEVAIASDLQWKPGARVSYYITGAEADVVGFKNCKLAAEWDPNFPDENVHYYLKRLTEFSRKFEEFFLPQDYRTIFSMDDLFGFSPKGLAVVTSQIQQETPDLYEKEEEREEKDISIWLDEEGESERASEK